MKILLVTQWYDPEPTFKGQLFAEKLIKKGNKVEVITGFPNYPEGKIYKGYKLSLYKKEIINGVVIHRVFLFPSHDKSIFKRAINYLSFSISALIFGLFKVKKIDIVYGYHPPLTTSLVSIIIGKFKKASSVIDIQDLWPDTLYGSGMLNNKFLFNFINYLCNYTYKNVSKIAVLSNGFKNTLISRGVDPQKIHVIYNWCHEEYVNNFSESKINLPSNNKLNIVFAGNIGKAQGIPTIIKAAELAELRNLPVNIVFIGDGIVKKDAQKLVETKKLKNTFFLERVPMQEINSILIKSDALLVHLNDDELFKITIPSKIQSSMAIGKPIIMGVAGEAAKIITKSQGGILCKPDCSESLCSAFESFSAKHKFELEAMGANAKDFYYKNMSMEIGINKFNKLFNYLLDQSS